MFAIRPDLPYKMFKDLQNAKPELAVARFGSSFNDAKHTAGIADKDLHFHDLRGTAATKFYIAGLPIRVIAEILAWSADQVERIIRRYVSRAAATKEAIRRLKEAKNK